MFAHCSSKTVTSVAAVTLTYLFRNQESVQQPRHRWAETITTTAIRSQFYSYSTAIRPRYDHSTTSIRLYAVRLKQIHCSEKTPIFTVFYISHGNFQIHTKIAGNILEKLYIPTTSPVGIRKEIFYRLACFELDQTSVGR